MEHHTLDPYPVPKEKAPLYVNEPWLIDKSLDCYKPCREPEDKPDNIRVYIPLDINHNAILRRLDRIIAVYREVEYSCAMKSHFRKFGNQMSGSGNHLCNYASLLA